MCNHLNRDQEELTELNTLHYSVGGKLRTDADGNSQSICRKHTEISAKKKEKHYCVFRSCSYQSSHDNFPIKRTNKNTAEVKTTFNRMYRLYMYIKYNGTPQESTLPSTTKEHISSMV